MAVEKSPGPAGLLGPLHLFRLPPRQGPVRMVSEKKGETHSASIRYSEALSGLLEVRNQHSGQKQGEPPSHYRLEPQDPEWGLPGQFLTLGSQGPLDLQVSSLSSGHSNLHVFLKSPGRAPQDHPWWNPGLSVCWEPRATVCCTCFTSWEAEARLSTKTFSTSPEICSWQLKPQPPMWMVCKSHFRPETTNSNVPVRKVQRGWSSKWGLERNRHRLQETTI